jgi:hypothetical protein
MRLRVAMLFALFTALGPRPVLADGGLPEVSSLQAGPFAASLHNDSPSLVTGANTLTLEVAGLPARSSVRLTLAGPHQQLLEVPLRPVQVLDGPADEGLGGHPHAPDATSHTMAEGGLMPQA